MATIDWSDCIIANWKSRGLKLRKGASENELEDAQKQLGYRWDEDFKSLYRKTDGFDREDFLGYLVILYSIDEIVDQAVYYREFNYIPFSDYMIGAALYGFRKEHPGIFKLHSGENNKPEMIASSFKEFIELLNKDDGSLY